MLQLCYWEARPTLLNLYVKVILFLSMPRRHKKRKGLAPLKLSNSWSGHLHPQTAVLPQKNPGTHWIGGWVTSRAGLGVLEKILLSLPGLKPRFLQYVALLLSHSFRSLPYNSSTVPSKTSSPQCFLSQLTVSPLFLNSLYQLNEVHCVTFICPFPTQITCFNKILIGKRASEVKNIVPLRGTTKNYFSTRLDILDVWESNNGESAWSSKESERNDGPKSRISGRGTVRVADNGVWLSLCRVQGQGQQLHWTVQTSFSDAKGR